MTQNGIVYRLKAVADCSGSRTRVADESNTSVSDNAGGDVSVLDGDKLGQMDAGVSAMGDSLQSYELETVYRCKDTVRSACCTASGMIVCGDKCTSVVLDCVTDSVVTSSVGIVLKIFETNQK